MEPAPRPRRPWLARLLSWKVGLPVAALLLAASGILAYRESQLRGLPDIGDPFDIEQFNAIEVAPEENAWPDYEAAGAMLVFPSGIDFHEIDTAHESGWDAATPAVRQWLEDNRPALERWRTGTGKPFCLRVRPSEIAIDTFAGSVQEAHTLSDLAILMALRLESEGDPQAAWGWHRALFRFSRHRGMHDAMIERLVGNAIHAISLRPISRWSANPALRPEDLRAALSDVREDFRLTAPPSMGLKYEYLFERDTLGRLDEVRDSYARIARDFSRPELLVPENVRLYFASEPEATRRLLQHQVLNLLPHIDKLPRDQPPLAPDVLYFDTPPDPTSGALSAADFSTQAQHCPLAEIAIVKGRLFNHYPRELTYQAALEVTLAAEWYRRVHGELPQDLSQLVAAGILSEVPDDPWSPVPAPLRYERDASDPSRAKVWSIGKNRIDDGGRLAPGDYDAGDVGLWIGGEPDSE